MFNFKFNTSDMLRIISNAYTGGSLKRTLAAMGMNVPAMTTSFYLGSESAEYILAASLACSQIGD